ncbi:substrate-binding domain-containing protein [Pseudarthrobacter raffinosi]|uniref:substrate-binding domain-containing protein n=1 Tax=Pseudarthrobacter raffinosi TaxID=2953651 RepID=UPI00208E332E|nr:substrate-binding domain-containing protein [Pseudarthrobacter sp. MDT3-9]MCO4253245.1 substrate-binding domain-containing protein [Pseudarthrobacter sp. MDT3-9]
MKDVAVAAGVSAASVSNAYHRPDKLSTDQRTRILSVAQDLGYSGPHPGASSLRSGSVGSLGLLITDSLSYAFEDPATVLLLRGIAQVSQMANVSLALLPSGSEAVPRRANGHRGAPVVEDVWPAVQRSVVDGFLIYSLPDDHSAVTSVLNRGLPCVIIDSPRIEGIPFVGIDDKDAAQKAAEHLLELGHRRIGILVDRLRPDGSRGFASQSRIRNAEDGVARARLDGYYSAFRRVGLIPSEVPVVEAGGFLFDEGRKAAERLLDRHDLTAVLATTDVLALSALKVLRTMRKTVPDDVSVIGFDDLPESAAAGLTTVGQPLVDKGRRAAEAIIQSVAGETVGSILLPTTLHVRASTGPVTTKIAPAATG